jgi:hypothetical protein
MSAIEPTLKTTMRKLRAILSLLLCLAVPTAGWASVVNGPICNRLAAHSDTSLAGDRHRAVQQVSISAHAESHEHCAHDAHSGHDTASDSHNCKCICGCGVNACTSSCAAGIARAQAGMFDSIAGSDTVSPVVDQHLSAAHRISLLRPPISLS